MEGERLRSLEPRWGGRDEQLWQGPLLRRCFGGGCKETYLL